MLFFRIKKEDVQKVEHNDARSLYNPTKARNKLAALEPVGYWTKKFFAAGCHAFFQEDYIIFPGTNVAAVNTHGLKPRSHHKGL